MLICHKFQYVVQITECRICNGKTIGSRTMGIAQASRELESSSPCRRRVSAESTISREPDCARRPPGNLRGQRCHASRLRCRKSASAAAPLPSPFHQEDRAEALGESAICRNSEWLVMPGAHRPFRLQTLGNPIKRPRRRRVQSHAPIGWIIHYLLIGTAHKPKIVATES